MSRRRGVATGLALGTLAGACLAIRPIAQSVAVRALSHRLPNAARRRGVRIDLGPARGEWTRLTLAADLGPELSEVVGRPLEASAYSRFGGFAPGRGYSAYLAPRSPYYQAWLGAYVVFDAPDRPPFGFTPAGEVQTAEVLDVLEADQRLVYRSLGCPMRFPDGRCTRVVGEPEVEPLKVNDVEWWRVTGEADTWSTYCAGGSADSRLRGRLLYGVGAPSAASPVDDFHPLRYAGEFWLRHDPGLGATCAAFVVAPYQPGLGRKLAPSEPLLLAARSLLRSVRFSRAPA